MEVSLLSIPRKMTRFRFYFDLRAFFRNAYYFAFVLDLRTRDFFLDRRVLLSDLFLDRLIFLLGFFLTFLVDVVFNLLSLFVEFENDFSDFFFKFPPLNFFEKVFSLSFPSFFIPLKPVPAIFLDPSTIVPTLLLIPLAIAPAISLAPSTTVSVPFPIPLEKAPGKSLDPSIDGVRVIGFFIFGKLQH